jgi:hypothetical protein
VAVTQQYLAGELSALLAELQALDPHQPMAAVTRLRRRAETLPTSGLSDVAARALELVEDLCWDCLTEGDTGMFTRVASIGVELREFGVCSGVLADNWCPTAHPSGGLA